MTAAREVFIEPAYGLRSLADVLPAVGVALGVDGWSRGPQGEAPTPTGLKLPPGPAYVVMLVDGMGYQLLEEHRQEAPYLCSLLGEPATCGVPSTTATSLTSLGTGLLPGTHGVVGFTSRIPGTEKLLNALFWDEAVDPMQWQPHPTAFERLARAGVHTSVVSEPAFEHSGLTRCSQRGAAYVGAKDVTSRILGAVRAAETQPSLTYVYDGDLDHVGHRYGVDSARWRAQLQAVDEDMQELRDALPADVRLVVVADHGMVDATDSSRLDVDEIPGLRDGVALLGGEARFRHVYVRAGAVADVVATWQEQLGERASVLTGEAAIARGWFGPVADAVRPRLGDVIVAAHNDLGLFSSRDFAYEQTLIGLHGSLTPREMLVPLLVI